MSKSLLGTLASADPPDFPFKLTGPGFYRDDVTRYHLPPPLSDRPEHFDSVAV